MKCFNRFHFQPISSATYKNQLFKILFAKSTKRQDFIGSPRTTAERSKVPWSASGSQTHISQACD